MPYQESVAQRLRQELSNQGTFTEKKMFGGLAFLRNGHMVCGVLDERIVLRLGKSLAAQALQQPHVSAMDFTGKPMKTMVYLEPQAFATPALLGKWLRHALDYSSELPPKSASPKRKK